ncbi:MAG: hypothetical protein ACT4OX_11230 [Actinomycetota bacterium]
MPRYDRCIAANASEQLGLITYDQLRGLGVTRRELRTMLDNGRLSIVRTHVYRICGAPQSREQGMCAAVLAAGKAAFASHESAAWLLQLPLPQPAALEVSTVLERSPRLPGVRVHRSGLSDALNARPVRGVMCATPDLVVIELSMRLGVSDLGRVADEAVRRHLTTLAEIRRTSKRLGPAPGRSPKKIAEMVERRLPGGELRESDLEDFVFSALRRFALPVPVMQHKVVVHGKQRRIDFCYVEEHLALEPKGFEFRRFRSKFDSDARRSNELVLAGFRELTFTAAFTDWQIARHVAEALNRRPPARPRSPLTFEEWKRLR